MTTPLYDPANLPPPSIKVDGRTLAEMRRRWAHHTGLLRHYLGSRLLEVAVHEGAHAVAAATLGETIVFVRIAANGDAGDARLTCNTSSKIGAEGRMLAIAAGGEAQRRYGFPLFSAGCDDDDRELRSLARTLRGLRATEEELEAEVELARSRAEELVAEEWSKIEKVAELLLIGHAVVAPMHSLRGLEHILDATDEERELLAKSPRQVGRAAF